MALQVRAFISVLDEIIAILRFPARFFARKLLNVIQYSASDWLNDASPRAWCIHVHS